MVLKNYLRLGVIVTVTFLTISCNSPIFTYKCDNYMRNIYMLIPSHNRIDVQDIKTNRINLSLPTGKKPISISKSPDEKLLLISNYESGNVSVYNNLKICENNSNDEPKLLGEVGSGSHPIGIAFNTKFSEAYVAYEGDSKILVLDVSNTNQLPIVKNVIELKDTKPRKIEVSQDGNKLYITDNLNGSLITLTRNESFFNKFVKETLDLEIEKKELQSNSPNNKIFPTDIMLDDIIIDHKKNLKKQNDQIIEVGSNRIFIANTTDDNIIVIKDNKIETKISLMSEEYPKQKISPRNILIYRDIDKDIEKMYVTGYDSNSIIVIDLKTLKIVKKLNFSDGISLASYNPIDIKIVKNTMFSFTSSPIILRDSIYVSFISGKTSRIISPDSDEIYSNLGTTIGIYEYPTGEMETINVE